MSVTFCCLAMFPVTGEIAALNILPLLLQVRLVH